MFHDTTMQGADFSASQAPVSVIQSQIDVNGSQGVARAETRPGAFIGPLGEWFDEGLDFIGPEGDALTDILLARLAASEEPRGRARRQVDAQNHRTLVRKLAVNGFRAAHYFNPPLVAVRRKGDAYKGRAQWLNGNAMERETNALDKAGMIEMNLGEHNVASTTYRVSDGFLAAAMDAGITEASVIHRLPPERLVRVYRVNSDDGELVDFEQDDQTRQWTAQLDAYNEFLGNQQLGISLTAADEALLTGRMNHERPKGTPRLVRPDLTRKSIYRQFNNGSFEVGGRLYGAWWINCPTELRRLITINQKPTVELDFSGCAVRMLYHEDKTDCEGDPYFLDGIEACERENGLEKGHFREDVKRLTQALINGREDGYAERVRLADRHSFKPYFTRNEVMAMIEQKHASIAHTFKTGAWGRLQKADSEIALTVIGTLMERGIVALPIHDSFLVTKENENALRDQMNEAYFNRFGSNPVIK